MNTSKWIRIGLSLTLAIQVVLSALVPVGTVAAASELDSPVSDLPVSPFNLSFINPELQSNDYPVDSEVESNVAAPLDTTLVVSILSSPWATVDSNPSGLDEPQVFVVQAAVTNAGIETAMNVSLTLDYQEDPINDWVLLPGETPLRTIDQLDVGETYYGYWMASYPSVHNNSHQYTVTADADNADPVWTSENFYMPDPDHTVTTRSTISTGSSGITQVSAETVVGVVFEIIVEYDLGSNPLEVVFSPVGNLDFDPSSYRLMGTQVRFYNDVGNWEQNVFDRLFFGTLDSRSDNATVTYTFLPQKPTPTRLCSYAAVSYSSNVKYDQFYCNEKEEGSIIPITGTLSIAMNKQVNAVEIQQGEVVTYTIEYTNTGTFPVTYAWIWDDVDPSVASVRLDSISPTPTISNSNLVAWYLGDIPTLDNPGSTGTLTFSVDVDGNDQPLADNTLLVNNAFYGVNPGSLPTERALTSTVTTTVQAPEITISKTDGLPTAEPGDTITYTLSITNSGSITATGLTITDVLPVNVSYLGSASPPPDSENGQTLVFDSLAPVAPAGGTASISIPVILDGQVPNGTVLTNTMSAQYYNTTGYLYQTAPTFDTTLVNAPVLTITKSDYPDPVLTGNPLTYTLSYANEGAMIASNVVITDVVPLSTTFQSCTGCTIDNGVVSWNIGDLDQTSEPLTVTYSVRVDDYLETGTTISNQDYGISSDQTVFVGGPVVTTTVSSDAAIVEGYTFMDANGDGLFTMGTEAVIPNLTLTMTNATVPVTTSDADGYYHFRVEIQGSGFVSSELPTDTFRTTPGTVFIDAVFGITETVNFGYAPINSDFGVVYGTVFQDDNHDGIQTLGEDGLSSVVLTSEQAVTQTVMTNALGQYTLRFDTPNTATITETNPTDYVSTTPDEVQTEVIIGSNNGSPVDFGDFLGIKIIGQVFDDINVNGVKDDGEGGVSGAQLSADTDSFTTGTSGDFTLYVPLSGSDPLLITEKDPVGYLSTNAVPGAEMSKVDANTLSIDLPVSGNIYSGADFGDVMASSVITVSGYVWDDNGAGGGVAGDGVWDVGEPPLAGAVISLSSGLTDTTESEGAFQLIAPPGLITVTETNPAGYASSNAIPGIGAAKLDNDTLVISGLVGGSTSSGNFFGDIATCTCAPDQFEEDDTWEQAKPIQVGAAYSQTHDFCDDAIDWMSFSAQAGQVYTITTTAWGQRADTYLSLYDSDGETLLAANDDYEDQTDFSSRIVWQAPSDGVYLIRVDNRAALNCCDTEYDIWIETPQITTFPIYLPLVIYNWVSPQAEDTDINSPAGVINHVCPDAYEVDDTWSQAYPIQTGVLQTHSFDSNPAVFAADKDLVSFDIASGETVIFTVETLTNTQTLLELYDAQGLALDVTGSTALNWTATNPGQYFLSVSPINQGDFGCSDVAGYDLLMEMHRQQFGIMLPLLMK